MKKRGPRCDRCRLCNVPSAPASLHDRAATTAPWTTHRSSSQTLMNSMRPLRHSMLRSASPNGRRPSGRRRRPGRGTSGCRRSTRRSCRARARAWAPRPATMSRGACKAHHRPRWTIFTRRRARTSAPAAACRSRKSRRSPICARLSRASRRPRAYAMRSIRSLLLPATQTRSRPRAACRACARSTTSAPSRPGLHRPQACGGARTPSPVAHRRVQRQVPRRYACATPTKSRNFRSSRLTRTAHRPARASQIGSRRL